MNSPITSIAVLRQVYIGKQDPESYHTKIDLLSYTCYDDNKTYSTVFGAAMESFYKVLKNAVYDGKIVLLTRGRDEVRLKDVDFPDKLNTNNTDGLMLSKTEMDVVLKEAKFLYADSDGGRLGFSQLEEFLDTCFQELPDYSGTDLMPINAPIQRESVKNSYADRYDRSEAREAAFIEAEKERRDLEDYNVSTRKHLRMVPGAW